MTDLTLGFLDAATGSLTLDAESPVSLAAADDLIELLASPTPVGCATPIEITTLDPNERSFEDRNLARISGYWHNDFMVGPGRRSVVRFQGCPIRCPGCWVPETWEPSGGNWAGIYQIANALTESGVERDGVTILGGEPFAQPLALYALVNALRLRRVRSIVVYTGFTREALSRRDDPYVDMILDSINILIDGRYVAGGAHSFDGCNCDDETRRWSGSCNQRVHYLRQSAGIPPA